MSPPAKKKRKTSAAGSAAVTGTRRTTRSQQPGLSLEMIAKVATFASYDGGDAMNICLAVGPTDAAVVRYTCLRKNMDFLRYTVRQFASKVTFQYDYFWHKSRVNINTWMAVNTDWRKLCTRERTEDDELSTARYDNEEGEIVYRTDPLIIFNNPAVAIEFGLVDVLKHLVEEVGIGVNVARWNGFARADKTHLLLLALLVVRIEERTACIDYLLSRRDLDTHSRCVEGVEGSIWHAALNGDMFPPWVFRAIITHESFDPNEFFDLSGMQVLPLMYAIRIVLTEGGKGLADATEAKLCKFGILLDEGADPEHQGEDELYPSPLDFLKIMLRGESGMALDAGRRMLAKMENKIAEE